MENLPIHTKLFADNSFGGLMLCGINHGRSREDERLDNLGVDRRDAFKSFFSDLRVNDYPFRNNIVKWFGLWGFPLEREEARAGALERSIVQTNWLQTCSNNVAGQAVRQECIRDSEDFLLTCERLKPALILLFSKELLWALASPDLRPRVEEIFGSATGSVEWIEKPTAGVTTFKIGRLQFERATVLSLPHATGARGVTDSFIAAQDTVQTEIASWWSAHQRPTPPQIATRFPAGAQIA